MQRDPYAPGGQFSDEHHDKWGVPILIAGILLVLVGAGIFARSLVQNNRALSINEHTENQHDNNSDEYDERSQELNASLDQNNNEAENSEENTAEEDQIVVDFSWDDFDISTLDIGVQDGFEGALPIYSDSLDLTGDGIPEAIFRGPSSNHDATIILQRDTQDNVKRLQEKTASGEVVPVYLFQVARAVVSADYEFLPSSGYYRVSRSLDEDGRVFVCDHFEVYTWEQSQQMFVFNDMQTQERLGDMCPHGIN